jgi:hypothetical protein
MEVKPSELSRPPRRNTSSTTTTVGVTKRNIAGQRRREAPPPGQCPDIRRNQGALSRDVEIVGRHILGGPAFLWGRSPALRKNSQRGRNVPPPLHAHTNVDTHRFRPSDLVRSLRFLQLRLLTLRAWL